MSRTKQTARVLKKIGALTLRSFIPGFFKIHGRYLVNFPIVWLAFFIAPYIAIKLSLVNVFGWFGAEAKKALTYDLLAILTLAICFYLAERLPEFRRHYVYLAPGVIFCGLIYWSLPMGVLNPGFWAVAVLIWLLSYLVWRITRSKGLYALDHGGSRKFAKTKKLYDASDYESAVPLLEKAVKRGHFKVLNLLGECHELGRGYAPDMSKAARYYLRAAKKGYRPAYASFERVYDQLDDDQRLDIERNLTRTGLEN